VTGKGKEHLLFAEASGSFLAYGVGSHRHMPEIEQGLVEANNGKPVNFSFTPHLLPMTCGILATMYVQCTAGVTVDNLREKLIETYEDAAFVDAAPKGGGMSPATCGEWTAVRPFHTHIDRQFDYLFAQNHAPD
jgi:N-acetyl-gamma-glutamyl-phosphate reductase